MTELPRSQALIRLDGPGHILPIEPNTPTGSRAWRVVHFPLILIVVALGLLGLAAVAINFVTFGVQQVGFTGRLRFVALASGMVGVVAVYAVFVRFVERRRDIGELGLRGWVKETGLAFCGGLILASTIFGILFLLGAVRVFQVNPAWVVLAPLVSAVCAAIVQELLLRGLLFRLIERLLGSWVALLLSALLFAALHFTDTRATALTALAIMLEGGLIFAATFMVTRRLWAPIGLHSAWNLAQGGLFGVALSLPKPLLVFLATGPDWLNGGAAGPNASLPALVIEAVLFLALLRIAIARGHIVRPTWRRGKVV